MVNTVANVMNANVMNATIMNANVMNATIMNDTIMNTIVNTDNTTHLKQFQHVLTPLVQNGWRFVKYESNIITMNKLFYELEELTIEYKYNHYHLTLPINNSIYSYYRKIPDLYDTLNYLELYIDGLY